MSVYIYKYKFKEIKNVIFCYQKQFCGMNIFQNNCITPVACNRFNISIIILCRLCSFNQWRFQDYEIQWEGGLNIQNPDLVSVI